MSGSQRIVFFILRAPNTPTWYDSMQYTPMKKFQNWTRNKEVLLISTGNLYYMLLLLTDLENSSE